MALGADGAERAVDEFTAVQRVVNLADIGGQAVPQFAHAGGGGGGHEKLEVRHARFQGADDLRAKVHLPDADRVQPENVAVGQRLFEARIIFREALGESPAPVAAPPHPRKVIRRGQDEKKDEQDVVKGAHVDVPN